MSSENQEDHLKEHRHCGIKVVGIYGHGFVLAYLVKEMYILIYLVASWQEKLEGAYYLFKLVMTLTGADMV